MEIINLIIEIVTLLAIGLVFIFIKIYLPSYLKEKGRNLATKEDIEEITDKIEKIRIQYTSEVERLKAALQILIEHQTKLQEQKNVALLRFFEDCLTLLGEKLTIRFGDIPYRDLSESLYGYQVSMERLFNKIYIDYHRLLLYFSDSDQIIRTAGRFVQSAVEFRQIFKQHFSKFKLALIEERGAFISDDDATINKRVDETNKAAKEYYANIDPTVQIMRSEFGKYLSALNSYFRSQGIETVLESLQPKE